MVVCERRNRGTDENEENGLSCQMMWWLPLFTTTLNDHQIPNRSL